jgi:hypothetical protein
MNAIALKRQEGRRPGTRSMLVPDKNGNGGWEKTLKAINDAVITRPFGMRMRLALQLFIEAIGAANGEGSAAHRRNGE